VRLLFTILLIFFTGLLLTCSQSTEPEKEPEMAVVYGEFQDATLMAEALASNPQLADWNSQEQFDQVTGATLQSKTLQYNVPPCHVYLDDELVAVSDGYGQFVFEAEEGSLSLMGSCEGYQDDNQQVTVHSNQKNYVIFVLTRD